MVIVLGLVKFFDTGIKYTGIDIVDDLMDKKEEIYETKRCVPDSDRSFRENLGSCQNLHERDEQHSSSQKKRRNTPG